MEKYEKLASEIGKLVDEKNKAYGSAFDNACDILKILYPNGVKVEQYKDLLAMTRIIDKLFRVATDPNAFHEEPIKDIVGYGLLWHNSNLDSTSDSTKDLEVTYLGKPSLPGKSGVEACYNIIDKVYELKHSTENQEQLYYIVELCSFDPLVRKVYLKAIGENVYFCFDKDMFESFLFPLRIDNKNIIELFEKKDRVKLKLYLINNSNGLFVNNLAILQKDN